jgi:DNA-binding transcriptional ArsR family regulator
MSDSAEILERISDKLDILISISRVAYAEELRGKAREVHGDPVATSILELVAEPKAYGDLSKMVAQNTGAAEITVKRKIADLKDSGLLRVRKVGRDAYYENSGLLA